MLAHIVTTLPAVSHATADEENAALHVTARVAVHFFTSTRVPNACEPHRSPVL
jgi:hypothetical protein